jgi:catechol 2,3-dioxygenase-like lactoylglutathione lyase family enzyme
MAAAAPAPLFWKIYREFDLEKNQTPVYPGFMLTDINPKLPMRNKSATKNFYLRLLGFQQWGGDFDDYLMIQRDEIQIHFFAFAGLDPENNYGQVYIRTHAIDDWYQFVKNNGVKVSALEVKPWKQKEFSILDPDNNLLTFGQAM